MRQSDYTLGPLGRTCPPAGKARYKIDLMKLCTRQLKLPSADLAQKSLHVLRKRAFENGADPMLLCAMQRISERSQPAEPRVFHHRLSWGHFDPTRLEQKTAVRTGEQTTVGGGRKTEV